MSVDLAHLAREKGHEIVLLGRGVKSPVSRYWPDLCPTGADIEQYIGRLQWNWGIRLRGLLVTDKDASDRRAYDFMRKHRIHRSPMEVQTKKGVHFYFRIAGDVKSKIKHLGMPLDLLTGNRFAVGPGSFIAETGHTYALRKGSSILSPGELPVFPTDILKEPAHEKPRPASLPVSKPLNGPIADLAAYLRRIPSVQGSNGSRGLMRACFVVLDQGLDLPTALAFLDQWSTACAAPPWDGDALVRAYHNAIRRRQGG